MTQGQNGHHYGDPKRDETEKYHLDPDKNVGTRSICDGSARHSIVVFVVCDCRDEDDGGEGGEEQPDRDAGDLEVQPSCFLSSDLYNQVRGNGEQRHADQSRRPAESDQVDDELTRKQRRVLEEGQFGES